MKPPIESLSPYPPKKPEDIGETALAQVIELHPLPDNIYPFPPRMINSGIGQ
jgi:hypothetical protein